MCLNHTNGYQITIMRNRRPTNPEGFREEESFHKSLLGRQVIAPMLMTILQKGPISLGMPWVSG